MLGELHRDIKRSAYDGFVLGLQKAIDEGLDIHAKDDEGWSALHYVVRGGSLICLKFLVGQGLDVNAKTDKGNTVLHFAVDHGRSACVRYLLGKGADIDIRNGKGKTAFDIATEVGHQEIEECFQAFMAAQSEAKTLNDKIQLGEFVEQEIRF